MIDRKPSAIACHVVSRRRSFQRCAAGLIILGAALRIYLAATLPIGYDEVYVMGLGLDAMAASPRAALVEVPMTRSTAAAPLWWWMQFITCVAGGRLSLFSLRVLPVLLGVATLVLAWRLAAARFGRRVGLLFLALASLSDILIFTNSRGEFAESFTTPLVLIAVCGIGRPKRAGRRAMIGALLLLTTLVKGILTLGLILTAELVAALTQSTPRRGHFAGVLISLLIALAPAVAYLVWAHQHFAGRNIPHDALAAGSVTDLVRALIFDYATIKAHVTGTVRDAAFVALDYAAWPTTALSAPLLLMAILWTALQAARRGLRPRGRRASACTALAVWAIVGCAVVVSRGTLGARFHLMYLPAAWMVTALAFGRLRRTMPAGAQFVGAAFYAASVGLAASWHDWTAASVNPRRFAAVAGFVILVFALIRLAAARKERLPARVAWTIGLGLTALSLCIAGPLSWASYARFEPMPRGEELAKLDAYRSGRAGFPPAVQRTLHIDLANYYLGGAADTPENRALALRYARWEAERDPRDARAWAYVGEALLRSGGDPWEIRDAWRRSLELAPNERLAERLARLEGALQSAKP